MLSKSTAFLFQLFFLSLEKLLNMSIPISNLIAGTMNWGSWGKNLTSHEMQKLINHCIENNITTFDHADIYGGYTTEKEFGTSWKDMDISRDSIQLITKCGIKYPSDERPYSIKHYDYSKDYITWSVEQSLKNLKTDYIDVLLLHRPSPLINPEEVAETITKLKISGKIIHFGLSNFTPSQSELIRRHTAVTYNQIQFSASSLDPMLNGEIDYMQLHNIRPMAWNPLGNVYKEDTQQSFRIRKILEKLSRKYQVSGDVILISWILHHPAKILPVIGTTSYERISKIKNAFQTQLEPEEWFAIWVESQGKKVP